MDYRPKIEPETAAKLATLIDDTGLVPALKSELYARWRADHSGATWQRIGVGLELIEMAETILRSMSYAGNGPDTGTDTADD